MKIPMSRISNVHRYQRQLPRVHHQRHPPLVQRQVSSHQPRPWREALQGSTI